MRRLLPLVLLLVSCGDQERGADQWPLSKEQLALDQSHPGARTYRRYCIGCHGVNGNGNGGVTGADLTGPDSPLRDKSDETLMMSVRDGKRGDRATMPPHRPVLSDREIADVIAYVRARFQPKDAPVEEASAAEVEAPNTAPAARRDGRPASTTPDGEAEP